MTAPGPNCEPQARAMRAAAEVALRFVEPGSLVGVGTGRTAAAFIEALAGSDRQPRAAVASSVRSMELLQAAGIEVVPLWGAGLLPLYVDGADVVDPELRLLKGGGGAHGGEKLVAGASTFFICIVDDSKLADTLQGHPVPVEVVPAFRDQALAALAELGGTPVTRDGFLTDRGNEVFDVTGLDLTDPLAMELRLEQLPGVVACGIFALRGADVLLVGHPDGSVEERSRF